MLQLPFDEILEVCPFSRDEFSPFMLFCLFTDLSHAKEFAFRPLALAFFANLKHFFRVSTNLDLKKCPAFRLQDLE